MPTIDRAKTTGPGRNRPCSIRNLRRGSALAATLVLAMMLTRSHPARASCATPEPKLVWTSPADGDTNVPTNAALWIMTASFGTVTSVAVNGLVAREGVTPFLYDPGLLAPDSDYRVVVTQTIPGHATPVTLDFGFTTGPSPSTGLSLNPRRSHPSCKRHVCSLVRARRCSRPDIAMTPVRTRTWFSRPRPIPWSGSCGG